MCIVFVSMHGPGHVPLFGKIIYVASLFIGCNYEEVVPEEQPKRVGCRPFLEEDADVRRRLGFCGFVRCLLGLFSVLFSF
jgi:hypothetical protein